MFSLIDELNVFFFFFSCTFAIDFLQIIDMLRDTRHEVEDLDMLERIRLTIINNPPHHHLVSMIYKFL
jgi:hypothetical protein